ncbi:hypothetical protein [Luteibacter sp. E-22]|uniref:hypothetical protein n=1 Tax=Luteibacter sp. E-22 TaxID=3404050 RepID=UPI003CF75730
MKNIQVIDGAINATYAICTAEDDQFDIIFPDGKDIEFIGDLFDRVGDTLADKVAGSLWQRPVDKHFVDGIHGTLIYEQIAKRDYFRSKRSTELDRVDTVAYRWLRKSAMATASSRTGKYLHVQISDDRPESDYPIFAVTRPEFALIFPDGADMEFEGDFVKRHGWLRGHKLLYRVFGRRIPKTMVRGIHGMLFRGGDSRKEIFPTKRSSEELTYAQRLHLEGAD